MVSVNGLPVGVHDDCGNFQLHPQQDNIQTWIISQPFVLIDGSRLIDGRVLNCVDADEITFAHGYSRKRGKADMRKPAHSSVHMIFTATCTAAVHLFRTALAFHFYAPEILNLIRN
jgi:hypothetical protein